MPVGLLSFAKSVTSYLGQVTTRSSVPFSADTTNKQFNSRSWHPASDGISSLKIGFANWCMFNDVETNIGGTGVLFASIEYPAGTFTRVLWGGSTSITIADGATAQSDALTIAIPKGASFYVRFFYTGAVASPRAGIAINVAQGDAFSTAPSGLSDQTMSGTITDGGAGGVFPCFVIGQTTKPTIVILGDSIAAGQNDTVDATGDVGSIARSIGPSFAYINLSTTGDYIQAFVSTHAKRLGIVAAASPTHIIIEYGRNDFFNLHRSSSQFLADLATVIGLFPSQKIITTTIVPSSTSTDAWATVVNQTTSNSTDDTSRKAANAAIRAGIAGAFQFAEIADVVESSRDSGLWKAPGKTVDGVHPVSASYLAIQSSGAINPSWFTL